VTNAEIALEILTLMGNDRSKGADRVPACAAIITAALDTARREALEEAADFAEAHAPYMTGGQLVASIRALQEKPGE